MQQIDSQEGLLDGYFVGSLLGFLLGVIIGNSVGKPDGEKEGCLLEIILGTPFIITVVFMCLIFVLAQWV